MISENAKQSINQVFSRAVRSSLAMGGDDTVEVELLSHDGADNAHSNIVVLTISSFLFRLLTVFHVSPDQPLAGYFARGDATRTFKDTFGEIGNLCCGAMNRELGLQFPHLGMSTPHMLEGRCAQHLDDLRPSYSSRHRITINNALSLDATLCLCAYAPLDFRVEAPVEVYSGGTIEFF